MRSADVLSEQLFTVKRLDEFIPASHPLRSVRETVNAALARLHAWTGCLKACTTPAAREGVPALRRLRFLYAGVPGGFLDGVAGLRYARMLAIYQQFIDLNCIELHKASKAEDGK